MRVEIDEAGRDDKIARVNLPCRLRIRQPANRRDSVAADPDVCSERRIAGAVDDAPAPDQQVVGRLLSGEREARQDGGNERGKTWRLEVERGL